MTGKSRIGNTKNRKWFLSKLRHDYDTMTLEDTWKILKDNRSFNNKIGTHQLEDLKEIVNYCKLKRTIGEPPYQIVRDLQHKGMI